MSSIKSDTGLSSASRCETPTPRNLKPCPLTSNQAPVSPFRERSTDPDTPGSSLARLKARPYPEQLDHSQPV